MKKLFPPAVALSISIFALSLLAPSGAWAQAKSPKVKGPKTETYMVIEIIDENKDEDKGERKHEFKAISTSQFKSERDRVKKDNEENLKEWKDELKTDPKARQPKTIIIKKLKTGYETQKIAQEYAKELADKEADKESGGDKPVDNKK